VRLLIEQRVGPRGVKVFSHRRYSLDAEQDELPADTVDIGALSVVDGADADVDWLDCTLALPITCVRAGYLEDEVREQLLDGAADVHIAISDLLVGSNPNYAIDVTLEGWDAPEVDVSGERLIGRLTSNWLVRFRIRKGDPTVGGTVPNF